MLMITMVMIIPIGDDEVKRKVKIEGQSTNNVSFVNLEIREI